MRFRRFGACSSLVPNYFPNDVGAVGGLVGLLGALGGFVLPKAFGWLGRGTDFPQAAFIALLLLVVGSLAWLHLAVRALSAAQAQSCIPIAERRSNAARGVSQGATFAAQE